MWEQKTMKNFVRVICLLLVCVFCLLAVVSCGGKKRKRGNYNVEIKVDENGVRWAKDEWGKWREYDNLSEELDYEGDTVTVYYWTGTSSVSPEFVQEEMVDDDRLASIYKRNEAIQDRLNIELNMIGEFGDSSAIESFVKKVEEAKTAQTHDYDIIAAYSRTQGALLTQGFIQNLSAIEDSHIEITKPWWPPRINDNLDIGGSLYYVSGDMAMTAIDNLHCVYFNKDLVDAKYEAEAKAFFQTNQHKYTDATDSRGKSTDTATYMLYELAYKGGDEKGGWTLDDLIKYSSGQYKDKTGNGISSDDTYGLVSIGYCLTALYGGANLRMIESDDTNVLKISDDWTSNRTNRLITKLNPLLSSNSYYTNEKDNDKFYAQPFINGTALFAVYYLRMATDYLVGNESVKEYGILPIPKYDQQQLNYYTVIGNEFSIFSIFTDCDERGDRQATLSMLTAVLECWASEAFRQTTPVVFELNMQLKSSPTQAETDMCELIRANIQFDMGRILDSALGGKVGKDTINMDSMAVDCALRGTSWVTITGQYMEKMQTNLKDFVRKLG